MHTLCTSHHVHTSRHVHTLCFTGRHVELVHASRRTSNVQSTVEVALQHNKGLAEGLYTLEVLRGSFLSAPRHVLVLHNPLAVMELRSMGAVIPDVQQREHVLADIAYVLECVDAFEGRMNRTTHEYRRTYEYVCLWGGGE